MPCFEPPAANNSQQEAEQLKILKPFDSHTMVAFLRGYSLLQIRLHLF
jgi:hypothetical protein